MRKNTIINVNIMIKLFAEELTDTVNKQTGMGLCGYSCGSHVQRTT
jgi:hypothetical protein